MTTLYSTEKLESLISIQLSLPDWLFLCAYPRLESPVRESKMKYDKPTKYCKLTRFVNNI